MDETRPFGENSPELIMIIPVTPRCEISQHFFHPDIRETEIVAYLTAHDTYLYNSTYKHIYIHHVLIIVLIMLSEYQK